MESDRPGRRRPGSASPRILIFGAHGQVGTELTRTLADVGTVVALGRRDADLASPASLRAVIRENRPAVVINAAAYTAVDRAESEPEMAEAVNGIAPGILAEESEASGACMVHFSTDYVFDGHKDTAYVEDDATGPLSAYGRTKLRGEGAVLRGCQRQITLRTSWVFAAHGSNFLKTILCLATDRDSLRVVADQYGAPTSAPLIAETATELLRVMLTAPADDRRWGLYHLAAGGETTWHGFAKYAIGRARELGWPLRTTAATVYPIPSAEYPTPAARPANSRLDTTRLRATFAVSLPDWESGVAAVLRQMNPSYDD